MSQTESGGRYDRSPSGLVAAMIVTLAAVIAVVLFRSFISDDVEVEPDDVAYLEVVEQAQSAGLAPVYPPELPEGWLATGAELSPGTPPGFVLNLLSDDEKFVGVRQEVESVDDLLEEYVVEDTEEGDAFEVSGSVASTWATYSDSGGDLAYVAELGGTTVLVYGSAGRDDIERIVGSLTTRRLPTPSPSP